MSEVAKFIGAQITRRREGLGLTEQQLADQLGIARGRLLEYEAGLMRVPASLLATIAEILKTNISYFFGGNRR